MIEELPANAGAFTFPKTERGNDPADWSEDLETVAEFRSLVGNAIDTALRPVNPMNWMEDYTVSDEEAAAISDPIWVVENLIIQGHLILICAEPNGGKTTILFKLAADMTQSGYQVTYINGDIAGSDAKTLVHQAKEGGFVLALPDMKIGKSMDDIVDSLRQTNKAGHNLDGQVLIVDTLKKIASVNNKDNTKELYKLFRSLTAKGMTVILLGHTNKYKADDGKPIFEGVGDHRADVDELIYLIPDKQIDDSMLVSTEPDKTRGSFKPITYQIYPDRTVELLEGYTDVLSLKQKRAQIAQDEDVIDAIIAALEAGPKVQSEVAKFCQQSAGIGRNTVRSVLQRYGSHANNPSMETLWIYEKRFQNNAKEYRLSGPPLREDK